MMNRTLQYKFFTGLCRILLIAFTFIIFHSSSFAQAPYSNQLEEITVTLNVQRIGNTEVTAFVQDQTVYLSVKEVFDFLKIKNTLSSNADSLTGFFVNPAATYTIIHETKSIFYNGKTTQMDAEGLLRTEGDLFLRLDYFDAVFGLTCTFDFRSLTVNLQTKIELPAIREMQQELLRKNISRLKGERKADTLIGRKYPFFRFGMADWSMSMNQTTDKPTDTRLNLSLGGVVAGGELISNLSYIPGQPFDERLQQYRWRYVNNENSVLRQLSIGKVNTEATSTLLGTVTGVQISNTPTTYRQSFGTYTLSNTTEPGWLVELYVNNVLVNYTRADASGFFTFEVPMIYGNTSVKLRFYGPWGEEQTREQTISIPYNFLPGHQFEYNITGGMVDDVDHNRFARASFKYGLDKNISVGSGVEYFTGATPRPFMPYVNASVRLFSRLILFGEHTQGVRTKGILSYRLPSNLQFDINYNSYEKGQTAVKFLEEKKATISMPIQTKKITAFTRLTVMQYDDLKTKTNAAELVLSSFFSGISANLTTSGSYKKASDPLLWSNLSMTFRLPSGFRLTQQSQYNYRNNQFDFFKAELEKNVFQKGFLNLTYQKDNVSKANIFGIGLRVNFSFAQASVFAVKTKESTSLYQYARGSLLYNGESKTIQTTNQSSVGRSALNIVAFLDANDNGKRDAGESKVSGLKLRINGGRQVPSVKDTSLQIMGLEAYNNYLLEIDKNSFDNVGWQIHNPTINVTADPNYFKVIEVPVSVMGEVDGKVSMQTEKGLSGQGRIIIRIFKKGKQVAKMMTEPDGYFSYLGLAPGNYTAEIDEEQLSNLNMKSTPSKIDFTIKTSTEGDVVEGLHFILQNK